MVFDSLKVGGLQTEILKKCKKLLNRFVTGSSAVSAHVSDARRLAGVHGGHEHAHHRSAHIAVDHVCLLPNRPIHDAHLDRVLLVRSVLLLFTTRRRWTTTEPAHARDHSDGHNTNIST